MSESISIPLTHIQSMLDESAPYWMHSRLRELEFILIQIQQSKDRRLLQDISRFDSNKLEKMQNDIRQFAYQMDDQLDTIYINIKSYGRWMKSNVPTVIKIMGITYLKSKFLHNFRSLINLVKNSTFVESQNFDIKDWNEENILSPHLQNDHNNFFYDYEKRIFGFESNSLGLYFSLNIGKNRIMKINFLWHYVYVKSIYENIYIQRCFQSIAWVSMKRNSKRITVYGDILKQLLPIDKKNDIVGLIAMNEDELWKELVNLLRSNNYLVLFSFDDDSEYDKSLVHLFYIPMSSTLLIITGGEEKDMDTLTYGVKLLESIIFQNHEKEYSNSEELKNIGLELIKKCNYVPRQIIRIGGVLREDVSTSHWKLVQRSLRYLNDSDSHWKIVALSYDCLSIHLKACFLYLGQFWEGDDISTEMLYQMWMAEGIVSSNLLVGEETTIDVAEKYLSMLARMLLIDVKESEFSTSRRFVLCRIDNFVKNFCLQPERFEEDFEMVDDTFCGFKSSSKDGRRLSMKLDISSHDDDHKHIDIFVANILNNASKKLRSLLIEKKIGTPRIQISFPSEICKRFKFLRVLKIENIEIRGGNLPKDIRSLSHLRFLSLEGSTFEEFPKTLGNFQFMQTLDLRVAEIIPREITLPNVLWKLKELKHLYLPTCHQVRNGKEKLSLNGLDKLEILVNFDIKKVELTSLEWKSLRHIDARVHGKRSTCDLIDCINKRGEKLKETFLHVSFSGFNYEESDVPLEDVLINCSRLNHFMVNWGRCDLKEFKLQSPLSSNLIELSLIRCQIKEDPVPIFGKLPQLRKLVLGRKSFSGTKILFREESFQSLRYLKLENLMHLRHIEILQGSMPNLFRLEIICCLRLEIIPNGLKFIKTLKELKLKMPKNFNDMIRIQNMHREKIEAVEHEPYIFLEDW